MSQKDMIDLVHRQVNRFNPITPDLPDQIDRQKVVTIFGNKSQFSGEIENSSCTSCAMGFLRYVLPMGLAWDLQPQQVSNYVDIGKALHSYVIESVKKRQEMMTEEEKESLGEGFVFYQAFSSYDTADYYGLKIIEARPARKLKENVLEHFKEELRGLEKMLDSERKGIGATIHCRNYTYALIIFDTARGREFVFFDSHGNANLNNGNPNAYIKYTFNLDTMARFLADLLPYRPLKVEASAIKDIEGQGGTAELEGAANTYICYVVELRPNERIIPEENSFEESGSEGKQSSVGSQVLTDHADKEASSSSPLSGARGGDGGGGPTPSRIHSFAVVLLAILGASLYIYRKPLMNMVTNFTTKMGLVSTKK